MAIKKIILLSIAINFIFAAAGTEVQCPTSTCASCGTISGTTWVQGTTNTAYCKVTECTSLTQTGLFDITCASCSSSGNYANNGQNGCTSSAAQVGANYNCQTSSKSCSTCPAIPGFTWNPSGSDTTNCNIASCLAVPYPTSVNDAFCTSCPQDGPSGKKVWANTGKTACVAATASCGRSSNWSDADCALCNGQSGNQYASADKTQCVATKSNSSIVKFGLVFALISLFI
ncbi:hypothetical protein ABPG74_021918 [Tetrahymena malaccensis]